jgi:hypothetical protein
MVAASLQFLEEDEDTESEFFNPPVRASNPQIHDKLFEHVAAEGACYVTESQFDS